MTAYEEIVHQEIQIWKQKLLKPAGPIKRITKQTQTKINSWIPQKVHSVITSSVKALTNATLAGSNLISKPTNVPASLYEKDQLLKEKLITYRKTAVLEGAGTGVGGIFLGLADFPLLLSIKMKFLYEAAGIYGYDINRYEERLFILHVFQLAFSNDTKRIETLQTIEHWDRQKAAIQDMNWQTFQQEYRDYLDIVKLLQLIPGFGAIVGAYANHNLLDQLGETALNAYRIRSLNSIG